MAVSYFILKIAILAKKILPLKSCLSITQIVPLQNYLELRPPFPEQSISVAPKFISTPNNISFLKKCVSKIREAENFRYSVNFVI